MDSPAPPGVTGPTSSPLRAIENEPGVPAPVGFWDPAGFGADGSSENSACRRQTVISTAASPCLRPGVASPGVHWQAAGLPVSVRWPEVRGCAERPGRHLQGAGRGLGSEPCLLGLCETSQDQFHELCAPPPDGDQAQPHRHACDHGSHHPEITGKRPGYLSPSIGL
jgi:hypothetical protein